MGSNTEKSNFAIAILKKLTFLKGTYQKLFRIFMRAIIFSPTVKDFFLINDNASHQ